MNTPSDERIESKICPFCGSGNISAGEVMAQHPDGRTTTQSQCMNCNAIGPEAALQFNEVDYGSVKSTSAWNQRAEQGKDGERHYPLWDGTITIDSDCTINGVEFKAGTKLSAAIDAQKADK